MDFPCSSTLRAGALLFAIGASPATAQMSRADADAYPCAKTAQLAVVQGDGSFSIREKIDRPAPPPVSAPAVLPAVIKLGNSLTLDSRLFARTSLVRPESVNVTQR